MVREDFRPARALLATVALTAVAVCVQAEDAAGASEIEEVVVIGSRARADVVAGSGTVVDHEALERFDYVDLNQVLSAVPGVYLREEDGFGLRPNIGIRGAAPERSQKITMMEDGVLIAPAPYSAPAAYYVPNVSRIHAVEVLKGPAAIPHGPHTVGGAINFVTRPVPDVPLAEVDLSAGSHGFHKVQAALGRPVGTSAYLVEALRYGSSGFKDLDGGGDTGFARHALDAKWRWAPDGAREQRLTVKLGHAEEDADETYLGLADADFDRDPLRRYRASQLGRFESRHALAHVNYGVAVAPRLRLNAKAYWHRFERSWNKVDGFIAGPGVSAVLRRPGDHGRQMRLLRGETDSTDADADLIDVTNNDRDFDVRGVQLTATVTGFHTGAFEHEVTAGARLHRDEVDRDHRQRGYLMSGGALVWDGIERGAKTANHAETDARAVFIADEIVRGDWRVTVGVRYEDIAGAFEDHRAGVAHESSQKVVSPGLGLHWTVSPRVSLLAGVYRGFSPAGPGSSDVDPEESLNLEYGVRFATPSWRLAAVGFFSDYENLLGRCRVTDAGCFAGEEFNGGRVEIAGAELVGWAAFPLTDALTLELDFNYTYTESAFQTSFLSQFAQWGLVRRGDELPYLPEHIGRAGARLTHGPWEISAAVRGQAQMREEPGYDALDQGLHADGFLVLDLALGRRLGAGTLVQFVVSNATDEAAIISHRPFGARPNRPRTLIARVKYAF